MLYVCATLISLLEAICRCFRYDDRLLRAIWWKGAFGSSAWSMAGEQFNGDAYELVLGGRKRGLIWQYKPEVGEDGLLLVVHNGKWLSSIEVREVECLKAPRHHLGWQCDAAFWCSQPVQLEGFGRGVQDGGVG